VPRHDLLAPTAAPPDLRAATATTLVGGRFRERAMVDGSVPVVRDVEALRAATAPWRAAGERIALVPTMGALHDGHLALVAAGRRTAERVVVSLFVNPKQFGPAEDFARYPRQEAADQLLLARAGVDLLFVPDLEVMYPAGFATSVSLDGALTSGLEGAWRPGHFAGVATVVLKLLLQARPQRALFGEKDYQQLQVIRRLVRDLDVDVEIVGVPTVRDAHGLALSSRNAMLSAEALGIARRLNTVLGELVTRLRAAPDAVDAACAQARDVLIAAGFGSVDYVAVVDADSLAPVARAAGRCRVLAAARLGGVRLIDNLSLDT
jgi:pantoate--beta-alanine ligase